MPFRSEAEKAKWDELLAQKKVTPEQYANKMLDTPAQLPERIHPKKPKDGPLKASLGSMISPDLRKRFGLT